MSGVGSSPSLDEAPRRLHPASMAISIVRAAPSTLLGIPAMLAVFARSDGWMVATAGAALVVAVAAVRYLTWSRFTYALAVDAVVVESGVFGRNRRTIPYERLADVGIERGPLHRALGLAKVTLETGGSEADEGSLDGVSHAEARRLRDALRNLRTSVHEIANVDATEAPPAAVEDAGVPLFAMSARRVLIAGSFEFSLVWIAVAFGALQYAGGLLDVDRGAVWEAAEASTGAARTAPALVWAVAIAVGGVVVLAAGVAAGVVRTVMRDHGFRLVDDGARLRRTRGLLTRSETAISLPRVQLATIDDGFLRRRSGWARLRAQVLGGGKGAEGFQDLAPLARETEIDGLLDVLRLRRARPDELRQVARGHVWRALLRRTAAPALLVLGTAWFFPPALLALTLLAPSAALSLFERRHHRYGLADGLLQVERGVLGRDVWIVPASRVQAVTVRRTWLQRRLGLASVLVDTAGGSRLHGPDVHDVREPDAWTLVRRLFGA